MKRFICESERSKDVEAYTQALCPLVPQNLIPREHIDRDHTGMNHSSEEVTIKESCSQVVSSHSSHANPFLPFHILPPFSHSAPRLPASDQVETDFVVVVISPLLD